MEGMMDKMDPEVEAKRQVLQEIKDLMDSRLGDSLNPNKVSMEKVEIGGEGEEPMEMESAEVPEMGMEEESPMGVGMDDKEKLMEMLRSKLG